MGEMEVPIRVCAWDDCDGVIEVWRDPRTVWCGQRCRVKNSHERRRARAAGEAVEASKAVVSWGAKPRVGNGQGSMPRPVGCSCSPVRADGSHAWLCLVSEIDWTGGGLDGS